MMNTSTRSSGYSNAAYCNMYDPDEYDCGSPLYQCHDETFVDEMYEYEYEEPREPPLGASTPGSTPRKGPGPRPQRQRSLSAPRHAAHVLAPMIAQLQDPPAIRRSRSAVFCKDAPESLGTRGQPARRTVAAGHNRYRAPRPQDLCQLRGLHKSASNLAVIPPNTRPLLAPSPPSPAPPPEKTWSALPPRPSNHTLRLSGLFLLFTSSLNCLLCFYLLSQLGLQKGRHYYIDFAVISGFAMLVLGYLGVRMSRYDWVLNRNYLAGYMVLSMLDVLLCGVLGLLASDWRPPDLPEVLEIASGAVCGLSALMLLLALCLGASTCCKSPPPDNRVSHSVPSFIV